jgi:flavin reductase (DIM6/NTAB) family NADH-FMN oxidoreductase RutF
MGKTVISAENGIIDGRELRNALGRFATGITVITTATNDGRKEALTANSFSALSLDPPLVLWSLVNEGPSREGFLTAGRFVINVLGSHQRNISNQFATTSDDKFEGVDWQPGLGGCPVLNDHLAAFECRIERTIDGGDHLLFVGRVEKLSYGDGSPLIFSGGKYCVAAELPDDTAQLDGETAFSDILQWS